MVISPACYTRETLKFLFIFPTQLSNLLLVWLLTLSKAHVRAVLCTFWFIYDYFMYNRDNFLQDDCLRGRDLTSIASVFFAISFNIQGRLISIVLIFVFSHTSANFLSLCSLLLVILLGSFIDMVI